MKTLRHLFAALALAGALASCSEKIEPEVPKEPEEEELPETATLLYRAPTNTEFRRIAYFPSYRPTSEAKVPDYIFESVDICCYAFASINSDFTVSLQSPTVLQSLVTRAHKMGKKVVISFNGSNATYVEMVSNVKNRTKFVKSVMEIVDKYNLDGVDNDWEYPRSTNGSGKGNFELMKQFSNILHAPDCNKLLTMAVTSGKYSGSVRDGILDGVFSCVDWLNIMIYDDFSTEVAGRNHASWDFMMTSYEYWINKRYLPGSKFVCGLPVYGRASGITQSGTTLSYSTILDKGGDPDADSATVSVSSSSFTGTYEIYYNGRPTIRRKVAFCKEKSLGGYMFWEQGQDCYTDKDKSLLWTAYQESL